MSLRIWGRISSINVKKVVWTAQEAGVAYERIDAGGAFGVVGTPEFRKLNPNGLVPVIEDDGFVLWESNAIVRYLAAKHASGTLYPEPLQARADADRWMDWQQTTANRASRDAFLQLFRTPPEKRNAELIAQSVAATDALFGLLDAQLAGRAFVCGDRFTMADIVLGVEAHRWYGLPVDRSPRPQVERWYGQLRARPAAAGVLDIPLS
jgi:glutathione S-transferase